MTEDEYEKYTIDIADDIMRFPEKYPTPTRIADKLQPCMMAANEKVRLAAAKYLKITARQFEAAIEKRRIAIEREERKLANQVREAEKLAEAQRSFGGEVANAREAVWSYMAHNDLGVTADLDCLRDNRKVQASLIEAEIILAAEARGYTLGNDKIMTNTGLKLAFVEYLETKRLECEAAIWAEIDQPVDPARGRKALLAFTALGHKMFADGEFGVIACLKGIWQIKRRYTGQYVRDLQMIVFQGEQRTGKTELARNLLKPLGLLATEADMGQVADDKNFGLRQLAAILVDELAKADRADRNKAKSVITGDIISTRVHYSHRSQQIPIRCTLIGTADKALHTYITDSAGMRRFVPIQMKRRKDIKIDDWHAEVEGLDWQGLWQAVDANTVDPLMSRFAEQLAEKQEFMRARESLEAWLEQLDVREMPAICIKEQGQGHIELHAQALYEYSFRQYENTFHPATRGTSLTMWGTNLREMIDTGVLEDWAYRTVQNQKLYRVRLDQAAPRRTAPQTNGGLAIIPRR